MKLTSESFSEGDWLPGRLAFAVPDAKTHVKLSDNLNPQLRWDDVPTGTQSFALICHDPDEPNSSEDVNQEGKEIPAELNRDTFYHWVIVNLPADCRSIKEGEFSAGVTPRGKDASIAPYGSIQGINDYTKWFADDEEMKGDYYGYDGPCPPWNDAKVHRYTFTLYALDTPHCEIGLRGTAEDALNAMDGHILAKASLSGRYTLTQRLLPNT